MGKSGEKTESHDGDKLLYLKNKKQYRHISMKEVQIHESEERFRSLVESSPNAILLTDNDGLIRLVNRQTELLFGYERKELMGKSLEFLLPERFRKKHVQYRHSYYYNPEARPMGTGRDLYALHKNGNETPVEIGLTPLHSGNTLMILSTIVDITERKRHEATLMKKIEELARFNDELKARTAQLIQSEKMSALGILIAGVAHELNNPITGILNYAKYCMKHVDANDRVAQILDDLVFEARRCAEIVKNLLTYSHYSNEMRSPHKNFSDFTQVIQRVIHLFSKLLEDTEIVVETGQDLPSLPIEEGRLQQILLNLIKNAIDAMENMKRKKLIIKTYQKAEYFYITVKDTGVGIDTKLADRIFDPFYTTKEVGRGTGLGLSVCKSIIEKYNSSIWAESELENRTCFFIRLPQLINYS